MATTTTTTTRTRPQVSVRFSDISQTEDCDCIVNPISSGIKERYATGIFAKAGPALQQELVRLLDNCGRFLEHGDCVSTHALSLPCKRIIHLAVPKPGNHAFRKESTYTCGLRNCVNNVLTACYEHGWTSIALPNLWQTQQTKCASLTEQAVAAMLVTCVREFTAKHKQFRVVFVLQSSREYNCYSAAVEQQLTKEVPAPRGLMPSRGPGRSESTSEPVSTEHARHRKRPLPLLSVRILGARLSQDRSGSYALYDIEAKCGSITSRVSRRFRSFVRLREMLLQSSDSAVRDMILSLRFPPKKVWGSRDLQVICERSERLNEFLQVLACSQAEDPYTDLTSVCIDSHGKEMCAIRGFLGIKLGNGLDQGSWAEGSAATATAGRAKENESRSKSMGGKSMGGKAKARSKTVLRSHGTTSSNSGLADVTNTQGVIQV